MKLLTVAILFFSLGAHGAVHTDTSSTASTPGDWQGNDDAPPGPPFYGLPTGRVLTNETITKSEAKALLNKLLPFGVYHGKDDHYDGGYCTVKLDEPTTRDMGITLYDGKRPDPNRLHGGVGPFLSNAATYTFYHYKIDITEGLQPLGIYEGILVEGTGFRYKFLLGPKQHGRINVEMLLRTGSAGYTLDRDNCPLNVK